MPTTTSKLAIHGGVPVRDVEKRPWPKWPVHGDDDRDALVRVVDSGKWWYGEEVARFERDFAEFQDADACVTVSNGTVAAEIAMQALGIGPGDEVIVPPYTFVSTAMSVARIGATPVFVDVDRTWCLDATQIEKAITPRTKAIMPVHFGAAIADMQAINAIAGDRDLYVIEDACHSWGAKWNDKGTGALGHCGVFSFQQSKNLTAAEGGCIVTDDPELAERCRSISNCGRVKGAQWFEHPVLGSNARITEFQGALLNVGLRRLPDQNELRRKNAAVLDEDFADVPGIVPQPVHRQGTLRTYHLYCMTFTADAFGCSREAFVEAAQAEGLNIAKGYFTPLYNQQFLDGVDYDYSGVRSMMAEDLCDRSALWFHHSMLLGDEQDMADIVTIVRKVNEHAADLE